MEQDQWSDETCGAAFNTAILQLRCRHVLFVRPLNMLIRVKEVLL